MPEEKKTSPWHKDKKKQYNVRLTDEEQKVLLNVQKEFLLENETQAIRFIVKDYLEKRQGNEESES